MLFIDTIWKKLNKSLEIKSRNLTFGERVLAQSIFAEHLDVSKIKIVAHRLVLPHYAISPNGHVYFNIQDWSDDFSEQSLMKQSWLIHELVHVWQIQQGLAVVRQAIFDRQYRYVLEQGKQFLHYGIEQQAQMVQDYFIRRAQGQSCAAYEDCIPFLRTQK
jgi:hypothetical protein